MDDQLALSLVEKYGTPLYVYQGEVIQKQVERLQNAFNVPELKINYACKALNNINVLKLMTSFGTGLDTVSIQEVRLGLHAGFEPEKILYTPNCVGFEESQAAVEMGVGINVIVGANLMLMMIKSMRKLYCRRQ